VWFKNKLHLESEVYVKLKRRDNRVEIPLQTRLVKEQAIVGIAQ
jgi:hypothetical protein